jgi:hypothetical protein
MESYGTLVLGPAASARHASLNQTHKLSYRGNTQLLHHSATMDLHRLFRRAQLSGDLLV